MRIIQNELSVVDRFIISITKNPMSDTYEFRIGVPSEWEFSSSDNINVETEMSTDEAYILKLSTEDETVVFDDFIDFIKLIVDVNIMIEEKKKELDDELNRQKSELEKMVSIKLDEIEKMKESTIKTFDKSKNKISATKEKSNNGINKKTEDK